MTTPKLERTVTLWPMVLFGLAYITPFIVLTTFGAFSEVSGRMLAGSYALTTIGDDLHRDQLRETCQRVPGIGFGLYKGARMRAVLLGGASDLMVPLTIHSASIVSSIQRPSSAG